MDALGFQSRLREAVSGGRQIWPDGKQSCLLLTYDMDADSSWIMRGLDEPVARSAGQFEVNVGTPCILELMKWFGLSTTFFTPGSPNSTHTWSSPLLRPALRSVFTATYTNRHRP